LKYRYAGGLPYTPFDLEASRQNYLLLGTGVLDFTQLNTQRLNALNQLDLRIDKKYNFKNTSLDLFLDFQNVCYSNNKAHRDTHSSATPTTPASNRPMEAPSNLMAVTPFLCFFKTTMRVLLHPSESSLNFSGKNEVVNYSVSG
jgi:hypothetical protein